MGGLNTFNLIRTTGVDGSEVGTWSAQLTQVSSSWTGSGGCCNQQVYDKNDQLLQAETTRMTSCSSNYNGGGNCWDSVAMAILAVLYHLVRDTGLIGENSAYFMTEQQVEAAEQSDVQMVPTETGV